jgi:nitrogen fixation protein FixH
MENMKDSNESKPEKKEWKWPYGILVAYLIFVGGTLGFVFMSFTVDWDLVSENYYQKTLVYEDHIQKESNALSLKVPVRIDVNSGEITVFYPADLVAAGIEGMVTMYRPADARLDFTLPMQIDSLGVQRLAAADLKRGQWNIELDWTSGEKHYFIRSDVYLQ